MGVQTPDGVQYTRAGNFALNAIGELVTARGYKVADQGGGTITVPPDARFIGIDEKGVVSTDQGAVGNIMIAEFKDYQKLDPAGNGLYRTEEQPLPATETRMMQGKLEGANVQPVVEMTRMIDVLREYQAVQRVMQSEHERQRGAIERMLRSS
jgi:flagellar basal-body rod protein FlgF